MCRSSLLLLSLCAACASAHHPPGSPAAPHPYDLAEWGPDGARLFAPGVISDGQVFSSAFEPDGRTVYFVSSGRGRASLSLRWSRFVAGRWTAPEPPPFAAPGAREIDPFFLGDRLLYNSNRPQTGQAAPLGQPERTDLDVWEVTRRRDGSFGQPRNLGAPINTLGADFYATATDDGTLYYVSIPPPPSQPQGASSPGLPALAISRAARTAGGRYAQPERLPDVINGGGASNPYIDRRERFLLFFADRPGGAGGTDLYLSVRQPDSWSEPESLGPLVNTPDQEFCPAISPDGKYLFFSRSRPIAGSSPPRFEWENIYYLPVSKLPALARALTR